MKRDKAATTILIWLSLCMMAILAVPVLLFLLLFTQVVFWVNKLIDRSH